VVAGVWVRPLLAFLPGFWGCQIICGSGFRVCAFWKTEDVTEGDLQELFIRRLQECGFALHWQSRIYVTVVGRFWCELFGLTFTNLSEDVTEGDLQELFRPFGPISRVSWLWTAPLSRTAASRSSTTTSGGAAP
jgi:hypothetical protein